MTAILFDIDDTLYDQVQPFQKAYDQVFGRKFDVSTESLFKASRRRSDEVFEKSQRGEMSMEEMHIYRIQKAMEDLGCSVTAEEALEFQRQYAANQKKIALTETVSSFLEECGRKEITMGIITNGPSEHQWNKVRLLGLTAWIPEEHIFVSGDLGVAKPDPGIFRRAEERLGLPPEELWFVGDSYVNDIAGAGAAGWHTLWLNRRNHDISGNAPGPDRQVKTEQEMCDEVRSILAG